MQNQPVILDLCGGTGSWSRFYREDPAYRVVIVDPGEWGSLAAVPGAEILEMDVRDFAYEVTEAVDSRAGRVRGIWLDDVRGILAAPPCTHFSRSGARWWAQKGEEVLIDALSIVEACFRVVDDTNPLWWCLENPAGRLRWFIGNPKIIIQPHHYAGHAEDPETQRYTKTTLLWGDFSLPEKQNLEPVRVCAQGSWIQKLGGKSDRTKRLRSMTPEGFARAFYLANP